MSLDIVTHGLDSTRSLTSNGLTTNLRPGKPSPTSLEQPVLVSANTPSFANTAQWQKIASSSRIYTPNGSMVTPLPGDLVDLGSGSTLGFDEVSLQGKITPVAGREMGRKLDSMYNGGQVSFNGSDLRIMLKVMERNNLSDVVMPRIAKQLIKCTSRYQGMNGGRNENPRARLTSLRITPGMIFPVFLRYGRHLKGFQTLRLVQRSDPSGCAFDPRRAGVYRRVRERHNGRESETPLS